MPLNVGWFVNEAIDNQKIFPKRTENCFAGNSMEEKGIPKLTLSWD